MKSKLFLIGLLFAVAAQAENLAQYVNPVIGTGDHGHVFLGASVPFGMVNAGPNQIEMGWDCAPAITKVARKSSALPRCT